MFLHLQQVRREIACSIYRENHVVAKQQLMPQMLSIHGTLSVVGSDVRHSMQPKLVTHAQHVRTSPLSASWDLQQRQSLPGSSDLSQ